MINSSFKGKMLVFGVFFLGIVMGILIGNVYETRVRGDVEVSSRKARSDRDMNRFYDYLGLSAEQRQQFHSIMEGDGPQYRKFFEETRPQFQAIQEQTRAKIRAILSDEQKKKYDEFNDRQRQRRARPN